jgi:uncharacterized membrane protein YfhO
MIPLTAFVWFALPLAVQLLLPKYVDGVAAARWALLDLFVICLMQVRILFFTIRRQKLYSSGMFVGIAVNFVALFFLTRHGMYLEAFPQALVIGRFVYIFVCYLILYGLCRRERRLQAA